MLPTINFGNLSGLASYGSESEQEESEEEEDEDEEDSDQELEISIKSKKLAWSMRKKDYGKKLIFSNVSCEMTLLVCLVYDMGNWG